MNFRRWSNIKEKYQINKKTNKRINKVTNNKFDKIIHFQQLF